MSFLTPTRRDVMQYGGAAAIALSAGGSALAAPKKGGTLRMGKAHGQTTDSYDPGTHENGFTIALTHTMNTYLTEVAPDGSVIGELAESWEASDDAVTWTFKLRDISFHNDTRVTSADVIASIRHHMGEDSKSAAKPILEDIAEIEARGDDAVVFTLSTGNADFPFILSDYHLPIGPASDDGTVDWDAGIGAGAYVLDSFEPGVRAKFTRFDGYWKTDRAHFDAVEILAIVDPAARTTALITGEVDVIDRVELKTVNLLKRRKNLNIETTDGTQHYTFVMNTTTGPYDDVNVRLALKHGIDREEMVSKILQGYGSVGNDHPIGRGQQFFASDLEQRTYDPDKAKFHLKEAGLDRLDVTLKAADAAFAGAVDAAVLFSETARESGIDMKLERVPNDGYWSNVWMQEPFCACYWSGRPTADWMFSTAYKSGVNWNDAFWANERFDTLLVEARSELDEGKRGEMYAEMQGLVRDDGGTIIPMFAQYVFATSDKVAHDEQMASNWDLDGERWAERWWFA